MTPQDVGEPMVYEWWTPDHTAQVRTLVGSHVAKADLQQGILDAMQCGAPPSTPIAKAVEKVAGEHFAQ